MGPDDVSGCGGCATACRECEDCSCRPRACGPWHCPCRVRDLRRLFDGDDGLRAGDEDEALDALVGVELDDEGCPQACLGGCPVCRPEFIAGSAAMARAYLGRG